MEGAAWVTPGERERGLYADRAGRDVRGISAEADRSPSGPSITVSSAPSSATVLTTEPAPAAAAADEAATVMLSPVRPAALPGERFQTFRGQPAAAMCAPCRCSCRRGR
jgi:hypothetical protein